MSANRRVFTEGFAALVVAFLLVGLGAVATRGAAKPDARPSTYVDSPLGLRALFLLLEGVGADARRLHHSPAEKDDTDTTVAIVAPTWPVSPAEIDAALAWVERGGRLVVIEAKDIPDETPRDASALFARLGRTVTRATSPETTSDSGNVVLAETPLAGDVRELRWRPPVRLAEKTDAPPADDRIGRVEVLATCDSLPVIEQFHLGAGSVVLVADDSFLTNLGLREADNAIFAVNLLLGGGAGAVAFDEFHHGADEGGSRLTLMDRLLGLTTGTWIGRGLLLALLAVLVHVAGRAIRFGAPLPEPPAARRSLTEHAAALGRLLERAGSMDSAARALLAGIARTCGRRAGAPRNVTPEALERSLRTSPAAGAADLADAVAATRVAAKSPLSPAEFQHVAARLAAARRRFLHE